MADQQPDIQWRSVYSTSANRVGYDAETGDLYVEWARGGKTSIYSDVPWDTFDALSKSVSVGNMIRDDIIPHHSHRYA